MEEIDNVLVQSFLEISIKEFEERFWGSSQQYREVMEVAWRDGIPNIVRIEKQEDDYAVYFSVKGEKFYYTHYFSVHPQVELIGVDITPATLATLRIYSDRLSIDEIQAKISIPATRTYKQGEKDKFMPIHKQNRLDFRPDQNTAGDIVKKLLALLDYLEPHEAALKELSNTGCQLYITVYWKAYIGNTMLGGFYLNKDIVKKLNNLDLEIDFDLYVSGISF